MKRASNDRLGLANIWHIVPKEVPRPDSAIKFDQRGGVAIDMQLQNQAEYWRQRQKKYKSMGSSRKNGKRDQQGS